jgi:hypothetical protein
MSLCLIKHHSLKIYGEGALELHACLILIVDRVVSILLMLLYYQRKTPSYTLDRRMDVPHSNSGCGDEQKNFCPHWESNPDPPDI